MADDASWTAPQKKTIGDVAVDGLLAGMAAGLAMVGVLLAAGLLNGISVTETLGRFDPGSDASPVVGALLHLAVAGLYGVVFAVISRLAGPRFGGSRYGWLLGRLTGCWSGWWPNSCCCHVWVLPWPIFLRRSSFPPISSMVSYWATCWGVTNRPRQR